MLELETDGKEEIDKSYLTVSKLSEIDEGHFLERKAYLVKTVPATDAQGNPFLRLLLRDTSHLQFVGRKFRVDLDSTEYLTLSKMAAQGVNIGFTQSYYKNMFAPIIESVTPVKGFDYSLFMPEVKGRNKMVEAVNKLIFDQCGMGNAFGTEDVSDSFESVCAGAVGGFGKLLHMCARDLSAFVGSPSVNGKEFLSIFVEVMSKYLEYLRTFDKLDVVLKHSVHLIAASPGKFQLNQLQKNIVMDAFLSLVEMGDPDHLYAHLIHGSVTSMKRRLNLCYQNGLVMKGSTSYVEGVKLSRY